MAVRNPGPAPARSIGDDSRMAGRARGFETIGDMLRSLAVVGIFVVVLLAITLRSEPDAGVKAVDPTSVISAVETAAPFPALLPGPPPDGWTVTSARVTLPTDDPYNWFIGYSTDTEAFVAVTQRFGEPAGFADEVGADGVDDGSVGIEGARWSKAERSDGSRRALTSTSGSGRTTVTTVVLGTAPYEVLEQTAAALRPVNRKPTVR